MLTWTQGLRKHYQQDDELLDAEVVAAAEDPDAEPIALISAKGWSAIRDVPNGRVAILEAEERGGISEVRRVAAQLSGAREVAPEVFVPFDRGPPALHALHSRSS